MFDTKKLIKASLQAGRDFLRPSPKNTRTALIEHILPALVPIRSLGRNHRTRIAHHLLALGPEDRYLRFGHWANDDQIFRYVASLDFERDEVFGIYNRNLDLIAVAHLAYAKDSRFDSCAEFGVSVLASARGRGYGARLFARAAMHATNDDVRLMFIHALSENAAMLKIARNAGAIVERDGTESEAYLRLPPPSLDTRVTELFEENVAMVDYRLKAQAKNFWEFLASLQEIRNSVAGADGENPV
jgi:GNAT superfamily N-acetyltransferase